MYVFFMDLRKAFDTVRHKIFKDKLLIYGLDKHSAGGMKTVSEGSVAQRQLVTSSVPQVSVLFNIFVNDFDDEAVYSQQDCR